MSVIGYSEYDMIEMLSSYYVMNDTVFSFHCLPTSFEDDGKSINYLFASIRFDGDLGKDGPIRFPMQKLSETEEDTVRKFPMMMFIDRYTGKEDYVFIGCRRKVNKSLDCFALVDTKENDVYIMLDFGKAVRVIAAPIDVTHVRMIGGPSVKNIENAIAGFSKTFDKYMMFTTELNGRFPLTSYDQISDLVESMPMEIIQNHLAAVAALDQSKIL